MPTSNETPAQTLLRVEQQNIAKYGQATPAVATGQVTRSGTASNLPTGFGADATGRIFRYNAEGQINPSPAPTANNGSSTSPTITSPSTSSVSPTPSTPSLAPAAPQPSIGSVSSILSPQEYQAKFGASKVDEEGIRERIRLENQARIDAINATYDAMISERKVVNEGNLGSTRAVNARSGLIGSDFGNANMSNQENENMKALGAINAERNLQVQNVFKEVSQLVQDEVKAKRLEAQGNADAYKEYLTSAQDKARESAKTLGAAGLSYDELKNTNPSALETILKNTGYDEFTLAQLMNTNKKAAERIEYQYKTAGNKLIGYGVNPKTGAIETIEKDLPPEFVGNEVKVIDGEIWSVGADGKSATKIGGPGQQTETKLPVSAQEYEYAKLNGYTGSYEQYQNEDANRKAKAAANPYASELPSGFSSATQQAINELQSGTPWSSAWNRVKTLYPNIPDATIDNALGTQWRDPGAYENYAKSLQQFRGTGNSNDEDQLLQALTQRYGS